MADFASRYTANTPGRFYVDDQCLDCDLCRETAPDLFDRDDEGGFSFVKRQPKTIEEVAICEQLANDCPMEAIGNDGDQGDWTTTSAPGRQS